MDGTAVFSKSAVSQNFIVICFTSLLGRMIGGLKISNINFSLGNTGGILIANCDSRHYWKNH